MESKYNNIIYYNYLLYKYYRKIKNFGSLFHKSIAARDIVVCGIPRSGSTLLYKLIEEIIITEIRNNEIYFASDKEYLDALNNDFSYTLKKNHIYSPLLVKRIKSQKSIGFFTHRDLRDVVVSFMQSGWLQDFDEYIRSEKLKRISYDAILYAKTRNIVCIRYEDLMNQTSLIMNKICNRLNIKLDVKDINYIIDKYSINKVKEMAKKKEGNIKMGKGADFHPNHVSDGKSGKWRKYLTEEQIKTIELQAYEFLKFFNYVS